MEETEQEGDGWLADIGAVGLGALGVAATVAMPWGGGEAIDAAIADSIGTEGALADADATADAEGAADNSLQTGAKNKVLARNATLRNEAQRARIDEMLRNPKAGQSVFDTQRLERFQNARKLLRNEGQTLLNEEGTNVMATVDNKGALQEFADADKGASALTKARAFRLTDATKAQMTANLKGNAVAATAAAASGAIGLVGERALEDVDPDPKPPAPDGPAGPAAAPPPYHPSQGDLYSANFGALFGGTGEGDGGRSVFG